MLSIETKDDNLINRYILNDTKPLNKKSIGERPKNSKKMYLIFALIFVGRNG